MEDNMISNMASFDNDLRGQCIVVILQNQRLITQESGKADDPVFFGLTVAYGQSCMQR